VTVGSARERGCRDRRIRFFICGAVLCESRIESCSSRKLQGRCYRLRPAKVDEVVVAVPPARGSDAPVEACDQTPTFPSRPLRRGTIFLPRAPRWFPLRSRSCAQRRSYGSCERRGPRFRCAVRGTVRCARLCHLAVWFVMSYAVSCRRAGQSMTIGGVPGSVSSPSRVRSSMRGAAANGPTCARARVRT